MLFHATNTKNVLSGKECSAIKDKLWLSVAIQELETLVVLG